MSEQPQRYALEVHGHTIGSLGRAVMARDEFGIAVYYADALAWVQREVEKARAEWIAAVEDESEARITQIGYEQGQRDERQRIKDGVEAIVRSWGITTDAPAVVAILAVIDEKGSDDEQ